MVWKIGLILFFQLVEYALKLNKEKKEQSIKDNDVHDGMKTELFRKHTVDGTREIKKERNSNYSDSKRTNRLLIASKQRAGSVPANKPTRSHPQHS